ncbi:MAG: hypothetical protein LBE27_06925 [Deltaproteobacteria bacterium]|jgi:hypothetical protein|nr:hypothetical protein [Deltaproteobacteria bacterium]
MIKLDLSSISSYRKSAKELANEKLSAYKDVLEVERECENINIYPGLIELERPKTIKKLEAVPHDLKSLGKEAVLNGEIYWEHTAAGEATRLMMGPKFFISPDQLKKRYLSICQESGERPELFDLIPLELGRRHLLQLVYEIRNLALEAGIDPNLVLERQKMLIVAAEETMPALIAQILKDFSSLFPLTMLRFMTQAAFPGLGKLNDVWDYVPGSPERLHNHGALVMQKAMERQIFKLSESGEPIYLTREENFTELEAYSDLVSYNIEDLDYLTRALDFESLGLATIMRKEGYSMMMEIVANNPERPIKGGCCAYDPTLQRDVVVESFRLKGYRPEDIHFLNKNFNHFMFPSRTLKKLIDFGLFMPVAVKDSYVYFQPVQGDLNFLEDTLFFTRSVMAPLNSLKSKADIKYALIAFDKQDRQAGFIKLAEDLLS